MNIQSMHHTISQNKRRQSTASNGAKAYANHKQTRSRRGCLTCRIRRKKCDEPNDQSACVSCTRLNIECLGYAPKRPPWLIATGQQCLEAIRRFLAERTKRDSNMLSLAEFYEAYNWVPTLKPSTPEVSSPDDMNRIEERDAPQEHGDLWTRPVNLSLFSAYPIPHHSAPDLSPSSSTTIPPTHFTDRGVLDLFLSSAPHEYDPSWPHNILLPGGSSQDLSSPKQPAVPQSSENHINHQAPPSMFPDYLDYPSNFSDARAQEGDDSNSQKLTPSLFPSEWSLDSAGGSPEFIPDMFPL